MGDSGGLYVPSETAAAMRDVLMPIADVATPNRFELEWMSGAKLDDLRSVIAAALDAGPRTMLVTSGTGDAGRQHRQPAAHVRPKRCLPNIASSTSRPTGSAT